MADESDVPSPFTRFRFDVIVGTPGRGSIRVPGFFAADGDAGTTGATGGAVWRALFRPEEVGTFTFTVAFAEGVAAATGGPAVPLPGIDGLTGSFEVAALPESARGNARHGPLRYTGERYLQFAAGGRFLKVGPDSPENMLAFYQFDGTEDRGGMGVGANPDQLHHFAPHIADWREGDPTWGRDGRGKAIIGALNYLATAGMNTFGFLTYNANGDGDDVWPFVRPSARTQYDVSKLEQWEVLLRHADDLGLHATIKLQETENDGDLDGGELGPERRLYLREMVARFGHHPAITWNLGEENTQSTRQRRDMAAHLAALDWCGHNIVLHTYPWQLEEVYTPLLGAGSALTGASVQADWDDVHAATLWLLDRADATGRPWVVANDEQGGAQHGIPPDPGWPGYSGSGPSRGELAHRVLWGNLMAGGSGIESYFGYAHPETDINAEDWRSRDGWWRLCAAAVFFFREHLEFWEMSAADDLVVGGGQDAYCLAGDGVYAAYLPSPADGAALDLSATAGETFTVQWFDPVHGGPLLDGSVAELDGGGVTALGMPPPGRGDWVALVRVKLASTVSNSTTATATTTTTAATHHAFSLLGRGACCRTESNGKGSFRRVLARSTQACMGACVTMGTGCFGIEYKANGGCELHTAPIATTAACGGGNACYRSVIGGPGAAGPFLDPMHPVEVSSAADRAAVVGATIGGCTAAVVLAGAFVVRRLRAHPYGHVELAHYPATPPL